MILKELTPSQAKGFELVYPLFVQGTFIENGRPLTEGDMFLLKEAGITSILAVKSEKDELSQNMACEILANEIIGLNTYWTPPLNGLLKIYAADKGILNVSRKRLERFNEKNETLILTTKTPFQMVEKDELIATLYISPPYLSKQSIESYILKLSGLSSLIKINPLKEKTFSFLRTTFSSFSEEKQKNFVKIIEKKISSYKGSLSHFEICSHTIDEVERQLEFLLDDTPDSYLFISGAFPSIHQNDVIPQALHNKGADIETFNIPIYPGFHLVKASFGSKQIYILPEDIEKSEQNSFDFLLRMISSEIPIDESLLRGLCVGGLLEKSINTNQTLKRTHRTVKTTTNIGVLILAGGLSKRSLKGNKLLLRHQGKSLIQRTVQNAIKSKASLVLTVTGFEAGLIEKELASLDTRCIFNPNFEEGVSRSISLANNFFPKEIDGVLILPGDMPCFDEKAINTLIEAFESDKIIIPTEGGLRHNPVLWSRLFLKNSLLLNEFPSIKQIFPTLEKNIKEIEMKKEDIFFDLNTLGDFDKFLEK